MKKLGYTPTEKYLEIIYDRLEFEIRLASLENYADSLKREIRNFAQKIPVVRTEYEGSVSLDPAHLMHRAIIQPKKHYFTVEMYNPPNVMEDSYLDYVVRENTKVAYLDMADDMANQLLFELKMITRKRALN